MEAQLEKIKEIQRESWNKASAGWKKWDELMMQFLQPMSDEMINMLRLQEDYEVLDIATGTGEPGLTIASLLKNGKVIATDISENMLAVAKANAEKRGLLNFETKYCEVSELPFEENTFDAITCRLGFMFFPDIEIALGEMKRVLKPGGLLVASVWNRPEDNFWVSNSMEIMIRQLQLKSPAPGGPGLFRCSSKSFMHDLFSKAGLNNIKENDVHGKMPCGTKENYWNFITEVASPLAFSKADALQQQQIKDEVLSRVDKKFPDGNVQLNSSATVICGQK
ncbi:MAG: methyltransferase domain-containing protein [Bacteroidota bacterium]